MQTRRRAPVTWIILAISLIAQLMVMAILPLAGISRMEAFQIPGIVPHFFWDGSQPWAPVSWLFIHDSWLQLFFACFSLGFLGASLENELGSLRYLWIYLVSGFGSALPVLFFTQDPYAVFGSSFGAIWGLLGVLSVFFPRTRINLLIVSLPVWLVAGLLGFCSLLAYGLNEYEFSFLLLYPAGLLAGIIYGFLALGLKPGGRLKLDLQILNLRQNPNVRDQNQTGQSRGGGSNAHVDTSQYLKAMQSRGGISGKLDSNADRAPQTRNKGVSDNTGLKGRMPAPRKPDKLIFPDTLPGEQTSQDKTSPLSEKTSTNSPSADKSALNAASNDTSTSKENSSPQATGKKLIYNSKTGQFEYKD